MKKNKTQTIGEEIANSVSHGIMCIFCIIATIIMLINKHEWNYILGATVFGFCSFFLYLSSCLYHSITNKTAKNIVFRRFDHSSIYLLIGGTYTPILLTLSTLTNTSFIPNISWGQLICIFQWLLIIIGITLKCVWFKKLHFVHVIIFVVLGWIGIFFIKDIYTFNIIFFWLILGGGISYTIGVFFYAYSKVEYFHFIWHIFTIIGTILQVMAILLYLYN